MSARAVPRVLFFDYWTKAIDRFARLVRATEGAADYRLLHLGSYRDPKVPQTEVLEGIPCFDLSLFRGMGLFDILRVLDPDVVIGLNVATLFDRAMYMSCERLGIPSIFVQHGSWADSDQVQEILDSQDRGLGIMDRVQRVPKFVRTLPWYLRARERSIIDPTPWRVIARLIATPLNSHFKPSAPEELWPTLALVFAQMAATRLAETHRLPPERIRVVGNPELDAVVRRRDTPLSAEERATIVQSIGLNPGRKVLCCLEDAYVEQQNFWSEDRRVETMVELQDICARAGIQLWIRPHPLTNTAPMLAALRDKSDVAISRKAPLTDCINASDVVLGTVSTALETAVVLRRPIIVPVWHLDGDASRSPCLRHGAAVAAESAVKLEGILRTLDPQVLAAPGGQRFVEERLGPLDGQCTARISSAILELANEHSKGRTGSG